MFFFILMLHVWKIAKNLPLHLESLGWTRSTAVVAENKRTSDVVVLALFLGAVLAVKVGVIRQISIGQWEIAVLRTCKKNIKFLKIVTEVKYPVIKVIGQSLNVWVAVSARSVSNGFSWCCLLYT